MPYNMTSVSVGPLLSDWIHMVDTLAYRYGFSLFIIAGCSIALRIHFRFSSMNALEYRLRELCIYLRKKYLFFICKYYVYLVLDTDNHKNVLEIDIVVHCECDI